MAWVPALGNSGINEPRWWTLSPETPHVTVRPGLLFWSTEARIGYVTHGCPMTMLWESSIRVCPWREPNIRIPRLGVFPAHMSPSWRIHPPAGKHVAEFIQDIIEFHLQLLQGATGLGVQLRGQGR